MGHSTPDFDAIRTAYLQDLRNLDPEAAIDGDSDNFIRASATASAADGLYRHIDWIGRQILPDTADEAALIAHAALRGLTPKQPTRAAGYVLWRGRLEKAAPAGLVFVHPTGLEVLTTAELAAGNYEEEEAQVPVQAALAGACLNCSGSPVKARQAPFSMEDEAALTLTGGTDAETQSELLTRLLYYMRNPEGGANAAAYERWAMNVPGVAWARCLPHRRGPGMVDVLITTADGEPGPDIIKAAQAEIDLRRPPACPDALVLGPTLQHVDFSIRLSLESGTIPALEPRIKAALQQYFARLKPGDSLILGRVLALLMGLEEVKDTRIDAPVGNVAAKSFVHWLKLGAVSYKGL